MRIGIYSPNWIGDSVLAIPFVQLLKKQEQGVEIIIVCKDWVSGVFENHPDVDEIISFSNFQLKGIFNLIETGNSLKKFKFEKFYTLTDSFRSAFILWLSCAKRRYGYRSQMRSIFLTDVKSYPSKMTHRSKKYLNLLGKNNGISTRPQIHLTNVETSWAKIEIDKLNLIKPIALFPFSVASNRNLPFAVLKKWIKNSKSNYLIFGSKNDTARGKRLIKDCDGNRIKSICGRYSLRESMALIKMCDYAVASDSGLGHLAAVIGLPTISFFGVGIDTITSPIGEKSKIIKHCNPCLGSLCKDLGNDRVCIKKISSFDIEVAVDELSNL